ncbi:hypothetical protein EXIGLDRAFT_802652 [Exidia glandulosa HHB12029]|uniref:F-box domain-containing protein n=1 Tax=Exidia glandulosa HHB12029 TaxID=1314781 RepID=A0A165E6Q7_EXIGL|nr:hypothetical protein EXIGLDRAFT_802652 [Exidia glandulosa HHB12029]
MAIAIAHEAVTQPRNPSLVVDATTFPAFESCLLSSTRYALGALATAINATAQISALPLELLCRIASYLPLTALCRASIVCQHWRQAFLRDTTLWRRLSIMLPDRPRGLQPSLMQILERNKGFPLSLDLFMQIPADPVVPAMARAFVPLLENHMHHIVSLYLTVPSVLRPHLLSFLRDTPAPVLRDLALDFQPMQRVLVRLPDQLFQGHAPELRRLYLTDCMLSPNTGRAVSKVTYLHYDHRSGMPSYRILQESLPVCSALTTLSFCGGSQPDNAPPAFLPVMYGVRDLRLVNTQNLDLEHVLSAFPHRTATSMSFRVFPHYSMLDAFLRRVCEGVTVTSFDIRYSLRVHSCDLVLGDVASDNFTIHINGQCVAVDVPRVLIVVLAKSAPELFETATRCALSVHLLDVLCALWPYLASLRELEFYMDMQFPAGHTLECPDLPVASDRTLDVLRIMASPVSWRIEHCTAGAEQVRNKLAYPGCWRTAGLEQVTHVDQVTNLIQMVKEGLGPDGLLSQELCDPMWPMPIALDVPGAEYTYSPMPSHVPAAPEMWCWEWKLNPIRL